VEVSVPARTLAISKEHCVVNHKSNPSGRVCICLLLIMSAGCRTKRVILIQRLLLFLHFWKQQQVLSGIHFCPDIKQEPMLAADWRLEKLLSVVVTDSWI
jgi:hypothetical protein